jgi:uncharacterized integral membrane protein
MIKFTAFFLLAISVTFCTVQKRIHRKGWHVEWRKSYKKAGINSYDEIVADKNSEDTTLVRNTRPVYALSAEDMEAEDIYTDDNELIEYKKARLENPEKRFVISKTDQVPKELKNVNSKNRMKRFESMDEKLVNENKSMISLILIVGALILAAIAIVILINLASVESLVLAIVGIVVLGLGSLLFLTLGLFLLIRQAVYKKHPEKRTERQARIDKKKNDPDYNPNTFNIVLGVIAVAVVTALFVWLVSFN